MNTEEPFRRQYLELSGDTGALLLGAEQLDVEDWEVIAVHDTPGDQPVLTVRAALAEELSDPPESGAKASLTLMDHQGCALCVVDAIPRLVNQLRDRRWLYEFEYGTTLPSESGGADMDTARV